MYFLYSILLALGFTVMSPLFLLRREKYAAGFDQRLGNYPEFKHDGRKVIWLHCVSVGETNAARPLVDKLKTNFPDHRLVISTTTKTGQELAQNIFKDKADALLYFPFDFKFAVRRALSNFKPSIVLLMETEIWPRFIREAKADGAKIVIVNGRLSERSVTRYKRIRSFIARVLQDIDLALMQGSNDANRLISLGMPAEKTIVTGNLKFDISIDEIDQELVDRFRARFGLGLGTFVVVGASTHEPEENYLLSAFAQLLETYPDTRWAMIVAPRHPQRFDHLAEMFDLFCKKKGISFARRSRPSEDENTGSILILLDSIGELRSIYDVADVVFVGGTLVPHGGQSIIEPASLGKPIFVGPFTENFQAAVTEFKKHNALIQDPDIERTSDPADWLLSQMDHLFRREEWRQQLGSNALAVIQANRGATKRTVDELRSLLLKARS